MGRLISAGTVCFAQPDFSWPPGSPSRPVGLSFGAFQLRLFLNNAILSWSLVDGTSIPDSGISAGRIYLNEISGAPGYYSVRFFPDRLGYWQVSLTLVSVGREQVMGFDALPSGVLRPSTGGIIASTGC